MGGIGSGRSSTRSLVEDAFIIDLNFMMKRNWIKDGQRGRFEFRFMHSGERIRTYYDLRVPHDAWIELNYRQYIGADLQPEIAQWIRLTFTQPYFGGRRWWMVCPCDGRRVAKLYRPGSGGTFACRTEWNLVYESQRRDQLLRTLARLDRIERQLGSGAALFDIQFCSR